MWRFIIVTITLALTTVVGRPLNTMEEDPWLTNFNKIPRNTGNNIDYFKKWPIDDENNNNNSIDYDTDYNNLFLDEKQNPYIKRGFSMLARWRPFSNIGKQRTSIREANRIPFNDLDIVSAETRAMLRPVGQPLRWG